MVQALAAGPSDVGPAAAARPSGVQVGTLLAGWSISMCLPRLTALDRPGSRIVLDVQRDIWG